MKKTVILDIDGVVLRWNSQLLSFLRSINQVPPGLAEKIANNEYVDLSFMGMEKIHAYHESVFASQLTPYHPETVEHVADLARYFNLVALTSFSDRPLAQQNRHANLELHYPGVFSEIVILPTMAPKKEELRRLRETYDVIGFVDDSPKHIAESQEVLGNERTFWLNTFNHGETFDCHHVESLRAMFEILYARHIEPVASATPTF